MKIMYPTDLVARPEHQNLNHNDIRLGDTVYVQPKEGPKIAAKVIYNAYLFGCKTFTADAKDPIHGRRLRMRFRLQDIHHVVPNTPLN